MRALSIRQPFAELILRGIKTIEYRTRSTTIVEERFYIYASKGQSRAENQASRVKKVWSTDLSAGEWNNPLPGLYLPPSLNADPLPWMLELATALKILPDDLPKGVIVGSAVIEKVTQGSGGTAGYYHWHLTEVERLKRPRKPRGHPQPMWFVG